MVIKNRWTEIIRDIIKQKEECIINSLIAITLACCTVITIESLYPNLVLVYWY